MQPIIKEKSVFRIFEIGLFLKGLNGLIEIIGGILILVLDKKEIVYFIFKLTQNELSDDPRDFIANFIVNAVGNFASSPQLIFTIYLLIHGAIKLFLIIGLFRNKIWAYPTSIVIFSLFIIYQFYGYYFSHSLELLIWTLLDVIIVILTIHEYKVRRKCLTGGF